ncbi:MAG TPA: bi-domain-containing oxidoreductase [Bryobacteraceae bacterium]|nr:bi-domain-containing oxidoreductase [Bryobacteraceae bacterium]
MKQVLRRGLKEIVVDELPDPVVQPHHVLVRPAYSLISSGTETASIHQGSLLKEVADNPSHLAKIWAAVRAMGPERTLAEVRAKFSEYAVLGYSGAGVVADKHATVTGLEVGDRVAYGGEGTGHGEVVLVGGNLAARIPPAVSFEHASFATLGSIAMNAVRVTEISLGEIVAVIGLGLVGQLVAQLVRLQGGVVIGVDLRQERAELAARLGADYPVGHGASAREAVMEITGGRGADAVIVAAAAKSDEPCRHALEMVRDRGRLVVVGAVDIHLPWLEMYLKEVRLLMARAYGPGSYDSLYERKGQDYPLPYVRWTENRNMSEFLRQVETGRVQLDALITHTFPLDRAAEAYRTILDPSSRSLAVLLRYPLADAGAAAAPYIPKRRVAVAEEGPAAAPTREPGIALLGAGNIARWAHLPALRKASGVRLRAICSASGARGKSYARRFGAEYATSDVEEILRDQSVGAVVIATRNTEHASQALAALRAGKHVLVEKPMALTEPECRELERAVGETGRWVWVAFNRRFAPLYLEQKQSLAHRTGPAVIHCRVNSPGISGSYWMADPAAGGAILGEACHFVDLFRWLLDSEIISVSAYCLPMGKGDPVGENNMAATFRFTDGSVANLTYCTVGSRTSGGERVEAFAQGLGVVCEDFKRLSSRTGSVRNVSRWFPDKGYDPQMREFVKALRTGSPPAVSVRDGARATVACLRMLESARTLRPCDVDLDAVIE